MSSDFEYGDDNYDNRASPNESICSEFSMDDSFLRRLFRACDTDNDGFLDRCVKPYHSVYVKSCK